MASKPQSGKEPSSAKGLGIYLLPNLLTTAGLFAGFYAIVAAMLGHFEIAGLAIFIAMVTDGMDGRVARLTNTQSAFGAEYDSLSDIVSFGVAPALVAYSWALSPLGKVGWLIAFIYVACGALRLARFNTHIGDADKRYFQGLAIPAAAGVIAGMVWFSKEIQLHGHEASILASILTVMVAALMVSNIRYYSFKELDLKGKVPFMAILVVVLLFVVVSVFPAAVLFLLFLGYALSGPIGVLLRWRRRRIAVKGRKKRQLKK